MGVEICKEVLGVVKSISSEGVFWEIETIPLNTELEKQWLSYTWKLQWGEGNGILQGICLEDSLARGGRKKA